MREIKFRVFDKFHFELLAWEEITGFGFEIKDVFENTQFELMQYIGLKDMNGVEIYEGDIVRAEEMPNDMFEVWFRSGLYHIGNWNTHGFSNAFSFFEVIGNRYENPDLLREGNQ